MSAHNRIHAYLPTSRTIKFRHETVNSTNIIAIISQSPVQSIVLGKTTCLNCRITFQYCFLQKMGVVGTNFDRGKSKNQIGGLEKSYNLRI